MDASNVYLEGIFKGKNDRNITVQMMMNTGNMTLHAMSVKCAIKLGFSIDNTKYSTVKINGKEVILCGRFGPISFRIKHLHGIVLTDSFVVIEELEGDIILSSISLSAKHSIKCTLSPCGRFVSIDGSKSSLLHIYPEEREAISNSYNESKSDHTPQEKWDAETIRRYCDLLPVASIGLRQESLSATKTIVIPANSIVSVYTSFSSADNVENKGVGYNYPRGFGKLDILMLEGISPCQPTYTKVNIANFESIAVTIHVGSNLGYTWEADPVEIKSITDYTYPPISISGRRITLVNADIPARENEFLHYNPVRIKATSSRPTVKPFRSIRQPYGLSISPCNLCQLTSEIYSSYPKSYIRLIIYEIIIDNWNSFRHIKPSSLLVSYFKTK